MGHFPFPSEEAQLTALDLPREWSAFWNTLGVQNDALRDEYYALIAARMGEAHRAYHNLDHMRALLRDFRSISHLVRDQAAFEWKIWFHDLVYQPGAPDNELQSAEIAKRLARDAGLRESFGSDVHDGIMATKTHAAATEDDRLLVTLDLAIPGRSRGAGSMSTNAKSPPNSWAIPISPAKLTARGGSPGRSPSAGASRSIRRNMDKKPLKQWPITIWAAPSRVWSRELS